VLKWLRCCAANRKVAGSIPAGVSGFFIDIISFLSHYGPGVDSASNRNKYQEYFVRSKGGRCVRLTILPPSCAVVMKSGNLNFLGTSGPVQACNGIALPFTCFEHMIDIHSDRIKGDKYLDSLFLKDDYASRRHPLCRTACWSSVMQHSLHPDT